MASKGLANGKPQYWQGCLTSLSLIGKMDTNTYTTGLRGLKHQGLWKRHLLSHNPRLRAGFDHHLNQAESTL